MQAQYVILSSKAGKEGARVEASGCCCFDVDRGQICVLTEHAVKKKGNWLPKVFTARDVHQSAADLRMCVRAGLKLPGIAARRKLQPAR